MDQVLGLLAKAGRANALAQHADEEPPLRSELFSVEQMEQHGRNLAVAHRLAADRAPDRLLPRLADNEAILAGVRDLLTVEVTEGRRIAPAAEWLIDNFYLIDEQIRTAKRHLPQGYSRELPRARARDRPPDFRASTTSRSRRSRTATAASTRTACPGSSRPTRRCHPSRWASCGRFRSCCASD